MIAPSLSLITPLLTARVPTDPVQAQMDQDAAWIGEHAEELIATYPGRFIAVFQGAVIATGGTQVEALANADLILEEEDEPVVMYIPSDPSQDPVSRFFLTTSTAATPSVPTDLPLQGTDEANVLSSWRGFLQEVARPRTREELTAGVVRPNGIVLLWPLYQDAFNHKVVLAATYDKTTGAFLQGVLHFVYYGRMGHISTVTLRSLEPAESDLVRFLRSLKRGPGSGGTSSPASGGGTTPPTSPSGGTGPAGGQSTLSYRWSEPARVGAVTDDGLLLPEVLGLPMLLTPAGIIGAKAVFPVEAAPRSLPQPSTPILP
ncbi:MAG: hypothetical protein Q7S98_00765 [Deltaproteobacteria bacterium]|nr:hypothetical protein [Deltaproteobacteria bacterium]